MAAVSVKAIEWAWAQNLDSTCKFVLVAICDCHNQKTGLCFPSVSHLVRKTSFTRKTIFKSLNTLADLGLISKVKTKGNNNNYSLNTDVLVLEGDQLKSKGKPQKAMSTSNPSTSPASEHDTPSPIYTSNPEGHTSNPDASASNPDDLILFNGNITGSNGKVNGKEKLAVPAKKKSKKKPKEKPQTKETWNAYIAAYTNRYKVAPIRNVTVNSQMAKFVQRVPMEEAPGIAVFFVYHQNRYYVQSGHCIGLLLRDAEKLRTEWATNTKITEGSARQADRTQTNANAFAPLLKAAREKEHGK